MTYQVVTNLNLFNGFYDQSSLKASLLNKEAAQLSLQRAKQQVTLDVTQTFFQIVLDQQIVTFAQQNFQTSNQREQQLKALIDTGRKAASDLYQQQSQTSMDKQFLTAAENKLRNDKILLLQKLRINDDEAAYRFEDAVPNGITTQDNEQALIQQALEQRYDLKSSKLNQEAVALGERKFRSGYLPKVYLSAGAYVTAAHYNKLKINNLDQYPSVRRGSAQCKLDDLRQELYTFQCCHRAGSSR
jgi:outer membrane protein